MESFSSFEIPETVNVFQLGPGREFEHEIQTEHGVDDVMCDSEEYPV